MTAVTQRDIMWVMDASIAARLDEFFQQYPEYRLSKGAMIVAGHEDPPGVMRLTSGSVVQYDIGKEGQKLVVNIFRPPAFFPMAWAINKVPNTYFFETLDSVRYRLAPPDETIKFLLQNPDILLDLMGRVYKGVEGVLRRMTYLMASDARTRLLFEIFIMCQRFGLKQSDGSCVIKVRESDLAAYTGLSRETVSRLLTALKAEKLLAMQRGELTVASTQELGRLLGLSE